MVSVVITSMPIRKSMVKVGHAGAHKLHHLVFHIAVGKHRTDDGQRHVLRADARAGRSGQIHAHHTGAYSHRRSDSDSCFTSSRPPSPMAMVPRAP